MTKIDDIRAKQLYADGKNDREIAEVFAVHHSAVSLWRKKYGLPSHKKHTTKQRTPGGRCEKVSDRKLIVPSIDALPPEVAERIAEAKPLLKTEPVVSQQLTAEGYSIHAQICERTISSSEAAIRRIHEVLDLNLQMDSDRIRMARLMMIGEILAAAGVAANT